MGVVENYSGPDTTAGDRTALAPQRTFWSSHSALHLGIIVLIWGAIYLPSLFWPPLLDDADSVHAEAAREMVLRNDWVTLHANGIRYIDKAPLMYWAVAKSFLLFGVSEWQARLPLALSVLALLSCVYLLGRHVYGARGGFWSTVIVATSSGVFIFTRFLIPDIIVGLWLTIGCYCLLRVVEGAPRARWFAWGFSAAAALSVLTKGLIGVVFPGAILVAFLLLTRDLRSLRRMYLPSSAGVFLLIAAPWHILAGLNNPAQGQVRGFFWYYFVNEQFLRYLNKRIPHDYNTVPLLVFWGLIFVWVMPWSAFLPSALREIRLRANGLHDRRTRANLLFAVWALVVLVFFSFSTRQEYYLVPALPAIALIIGGWLDRESQPEALAARRSGVRASVAFFIIAMVAVLAAAIILVTVGRPAAGTDLAELLRQNPQEYTFSFGHIFDLTPQALSLFRAPLLAFALALGCGALANLLLRRNGRPGTANAVLTAAMVVVLLASWVGFIRFSPILSSKDLAVAVSRVYSPGDIIVIRGEYQEGSTLNFYTGHQVHILHGHVGLWYGSLFPDAPKIWETDKSLRALWAGTHRVYLWADVPRPPELGDMRTFVLASSGGKWILTNRQ